MLWPGANWPSQETENRPWLLWQAQQQEVSGKGPLQYDEAMLKLKDWLSQNLASTVRAILSGALVGSAEREVVLGKTVAKACELGRSVQDNWSSPDQQSEDCQP